MEWSRTTQVVAHTCGMVAHLPNAGFARLCPNFALLASCSWIFAPNAQWGWPKREFSFYRVILKNFDFRNPFSNVFNLLFFLTLFRVFLSWNELFWCVWLRSFCRLTIWWTVVKELGLLPALLQIFENFFIFTNSSWPWIKNRVFNPRHKMSCSWWK